MGRCRFCGGLRFERDSTAEKEFSSSCWSWTGRYLGAFASLGALFFFYFFHERRACSDFIIIGVWARPESQLRGLQRHSLSERGCFAGVDRADRPLYPVRSENFDMVKLAQHILGVNGQDHILCRRVASI